jgi:hypothetical protein
VLSNFSSYKNKQTFVVNLKFKKIQGKKNSTPHQREKKKYSKISGNANMLTKGKREKIEKDFVTLSRLRDKVVKLAVVDVCRLFLFNFHRKWSENSQS